MDPIASAVFELDDADWRIRRFYETFDKVCSQFKKTRAQICHLALYPSEDLELHKYLGRVIPTFWKGVRTHDALDNVLRKGPLWWLDANGEPDAFATAVLDMVREFPVFRLKWFELADDCRMGREGMIAPRYELTILYDIFDSAYTKMWKIINEGVYDETDFMMLQRFNKLTADPSVPQNDVKIPKS